MRHLRDELYVKMTDWWTDAQLSAIAGRRMPSTATLLAGSIASSFALYVLLTKLTKQSEEAAQEAEPAASNEDAATSSSEQHQTAEDPAELLLSTKAELDRLLERYAELRKAQDDADVTAVTSDYTMLCSHTHEAGTEIKSKLPRRSHLSAGPSWHTSITPMISIHLTSDTAKQAGTPTYLSHTTLAPIDSGTNQITGPHCVLTHPNVHLPSYPPRLTIVAIVCLH